MAQPATVNVSVNGSQPQPLAVAQAVTVATHAGAQSTGGPIAFTAPYQAPRQEPFKPDTLAFAKCAVFSTVVESVGTLGWCIGACWGVCNLYAPCWAFWYCICGLAHTGTGIAGGSAFSCCCRNGQGTKCGCINHTISLVFRILAFFAIIIIHSMNPGSQTATNVCVPMYFLLIILMIDNVMMIVYAQKAQKDFPENQDSCCASSHGGHASGNANVTTGPVMVTLPNTGNVVGAGQPQTGTIVGQPAARMGTIVSQPGAPAEMEMTTLSTTTTQEQAEMQV